MWIIFLSIAFVATVIRLLQFKRGYIAMWVALSATALTLCSFITMIVGWISQNDMSALADVVPTMHIVYWIFTVCMIVLNVLPLVLKKKNQVKYVS